ncbi:MAG: hypothetical protein Q8O62_01825 [Aequorivita sp.]|nr:hypothetical protein [Aequorivita sp.]
MQQMQVQSINEGYLFFKRNKTNGRLDTNLTSLPGYLKQFIINTKNENLVHLDIKNSQPFFFYTLLKNNKSVEPLELERYKNLILTGNLYEYLIEEYLKVSDSKTFKYLEQEEKRNYIKKLLFKIFYSKVNSFKKQKDFFGGLFPTIMEVINEKNLSVHNTLAIELQTMESFTIIDKLLINLQEKNILPLTIHDSFLCSESEIDIVLKEINNVFTNLYGCVPQLHYDVIGKPVIQDDIETETKDIYADLSFEEFLDIINSEDFIPTLTEDELFEYDIYIPNDKPFEQQEIKTLTIEELLQVA